MSKYARLLVVSLIVALLLGAVLTSVASAWGPYQRYPYRGYYPAYWGGCNPCGGGYPYWGGGYPYSGGYGWSTTTVTTWTTSWWGGGPYWGGGWYW